MAHWAHTGSQHLSISQHSTTVHCPAHLSNCLFIYLCFQTHTFQYTHAMSRIKQQKKCSMLQSSIPGLCPTVHPSPVCAVTSWWEESYDCCDYCDYCDYWPPDNVPPNMSPVERSPALTKRILFSSRPGSIHHIEIGCGHIDKKSSIEYS